MNKGDFEKELKISSFGKEDIKWWLDNLGNMYAPINLPSIQTTISCDASDIGWGDVLADKTTVGACTPDEQKLHINCKEMLAIYYGLRSFYDSIKGFHLRVLSDNTTAVSVINKMGTVRSPQCNNLARLIWQFFSDGNIWITCAHIPGLYNVESDLENPLSINNLTSS